jgi:putative hemolysin
VPGSFEVSRLRELFADTMDDGQRVAEDGEPSEDEEGKDTASAARVPLYFPQHYEATTLGGLVSEIAGHIPQPGEVVEQDGLRFEVLESTDRKVDRLRVGLVEKAAA